MPKYVQMDRPLSVDTPLGKDVLLLTDFRGHEGISQLFSFQLELLAERGTDIRFDKILGESVTVELRMANGSTRYFNGLVKRFSQGVRDETFVKFRAEVVPKPWLLTKKVRSRVFQHLSVPDILRQVFAGLNVKYQISGTYQPRDYCVQYRESDFAFASRLMEEEGIYYFFQHSSGNDQMVVTDLANPTVEGQSSIIYEELFHGGTREDMRITNWEKSQELRSGEYTLWDHCFELPGNNLEATRKTADSVTVGTVTHKLSVGGNDQLEIYDFPGGYAQRFDGVDSNGSPRPADLKLIFEDRDRTVRVRMEQEDAACLEIQGVGDCGNFSAGFKFTLERHFDADGQYLLTQVGHEARMSGYRSEETQAFHYENHFTCIPAGLRYRPQRLTPRPKIAGMQTATVVGPTGSEVFVDKYGRVKVQFHWDREGKKNAGSSCWLRVAQAWAGKGWGAFFWPRIGHEVVVTFEEGDPDQPLIIGSVYNAENMPPYELPKKRQLTGFKSASYRGKPFENFNGVIFNDDQGHEHLALHSERSMSFNTEYDKMHHAGRHSGDRVSSAKVSTCGNLPLGGGSGGGGDFDDSVAPMPHPKPLAVLGLNSQWTFGENLQVAFGLNHQLAFGSNLQICVNPMGGGGAGDPSIWLAPPQTELNGSGPGGNMQLTFGTSAQFVLGQSFQITLGPTPINVTATTNDHPTTVACCGFLYAAVVLWGLVYGLSSGPSDDVKRAAWTCVFQGIIDIILVAIMISEMELKAADAHLEDALKPLFRVDHPEPTADESNVGRFVAENVILLGIVAAPIIATIAEAAGA